MPSLADRVRSALLDHGPMTQQELLVHVDAPQPSVSRLLTNPDQTSFTSTPGPSKLFYLAKAGPPQNTESLMRWLTLQSIRLVRWYTYTVQHEGRHVANAQAADKLRQLALKLTMRLDELETTELDIERD